MKGQFFVWFGLLSILLAGTAQAAVVFSETFDYPDGPLVTISGGKWITHSGTPVQAEVVSGEARLSQGKSEDVHALLEGEPDSVANAVALYASFQVRFSKLPTGAGGTYFAHFKDASATAGFRCRIFASTNGAATGAFRLGIAAAAGDTGEWLPNDLELEVPYRVVCRINLEDNVSTLWLNPNSESDPGVTSTDTATPKTVTAFALRQSFSSGAGMGDLAVDDIRVATTFIELSAAPGSAALTLNISPEPGGRVRLWWKAAPEQTYTVLQAASTQTDFVPMATGLSFPDGLGAYEDSIAPASPIRFYRVCSP